MSEKEATRFIEDMKSVDGMIAEFTPVMSDPKAAYALLKAKGYDASPEEVREAYLEFASTALSDQEIAEVSAGLSDAAKAGITAGAVVGATVAGGVAAAATVGIAMAAIGACSAAAAI